MRNWKVQGLLLALLSLSTWANAAEFMVCETGERAVHDAPVMCELSKVLDAKGVYRGDKQFAMKKTLSELNAEGWRVESFTTTGTGGQILVFLMVKGDQPAGK